MAAEKFAMDLHQALPVFEMPGKRGVWNDLSLRDMGGAARIRHAASSCQGADTRSMSKLHNENELRHGRGAVGSSERLAAPGGRRIDLAA